MIKLLIFAFLYLGDFSHINSLQFTGRGFCAATDGGVLVYDMEKGITLSLVANAPYLAAYDLSSREVAFIDRSNNLYIYSNFFHTLMKIAHVQGVVRMGLQNGIVMLLFANGTKRYISKFNEPAPRIYIDSMKIAGGHEIPIYLKTRNYQNNCYAFYKPTAFARGYNYDYVGTNGSGVFIFDRTVKKELKNVFVNIKPPVYKLTVVFDTVYILHSEGLTRISGKYVHSLTTNCFQNGYSPVDLLFTENAGYVINSEGYYTINEPFFFTAFPSECGDAVKVLYDDNGGLIISEHCIFRMDKGGNLKKLTAINRYTVQDAGALENKLYLVLDGRLTSLVDTAFEDVIYDKEPIVTNRIIQGLYTLYVPAKRGLFLIDNSKVSLIRSPYNLLDIVDGTEDENQLYLASQNRVIKFNVTRDNWENLTVENTSLSDITAIATMGGKIYIATSKGVIVR